MKKKIMAALMATFLFAGMVATASADINASSMLGSGADATKIEVSKDALTVKHGDKVDLLDYITVLVSNSQLANHDTLIFDIEDNTDLAFTQDGSEFTAVESKGTATAVIKSENEKIVKKIKLTATKATVVHATGYKYEKTSYNIASNDASVPDAELKIVPTPTGAVFSQAQIDTLKAAALTAQNGVTPTGEGTKVADGMAAGEYKDFVVTFAADDLKTAANADVETRTTAVAFPMGSTSNTNPRTASTKVTFVKYALKNSIASKGTVTVKVGQTVDLAGNVKQGPSSASTDDDVSFAIDYYNDASDSFDFATLEGTEITGIATGKVKITATLAGGATTSFVVNVIDYSPEASKPEENDGKLGLSFSVAKTIVGGTFKLNVKNAPKDATIKFTSLNDKVATIDANGAVKGIAVGTTSVVADVNGQKLYCKVTVDSGKVKPEVNVPATGVVTLNPLF